MHGDGCHLFAYLCSSCRYPVLLWSQCWLCARTHYDRIKIMMLVSIVADPVRDSTGLVLQSLHLSSCNGMAAAPGFSSSAKWQAWKLTPGISWSAGTRCSFDVSSTVHSTVKLISGLM